MFLDDILTAIARIEAYTVEGKVVFLRDGKTQDAVIRQLSVIGEAAAKLPAVVRARQPDIPWKAVVGMRIAHPAELVLLQRFAGDIQFKEEVK